MLSSIEDKDVQYQWGNALITRSKVQIIYN